MIHKFYKVFVFVQYWQNTAIVLKIFIQLLFLFYASAEGTSRNMKLVFIVVSSQLWNPTLQSHTTKVDWFRLSRKKNIAWFIARIGGKTYIFQLYHQRVNHTTHKTCITILADNNFIPILQGRKWQIAFYFIRK